MARISLRMSLINVLFFCLLILLFPGSVNSRWCTRLKSEKQVHTFIEPAQCNQSYQAACGWFTRKQCTFYELVECPKERNHTVVRYKIIEECCPGYKLDPINNITCLRDKDEELGKEEVTPGYSIVTEADLSPLVGKDDLPEANLTKNISRGGATGNEDAVHYLESDDGLFLGLSHGAYAGIICSLLFVLCVCILIALHVYKKKQKDRLKASNQAMEMGVTEKMMPQVNT